MATLASTRLASAESDLPLDLAGLSDSGSSLKKRLGGERLTLEEAIAAEFEAQPTLSREPLLQPSVQILSESLTTPSAAVDPELFSELDGSELSGRVPPAPRPLAFSSETADLFSGSATNAATNTATQTTTLAERGALSSSAFGPQTEDVPEMLHGRDDRIRVTNTTGDPWRRIARLEIGGSVGTGALISPFHILTAAHNVYNKSTGWAARSQINVNLGQNGSERFYGSAKVTRMRSFKGWTGDNNWSRQGDGSWRRRNNYHDMAVLTLDRNIGDFTGWFGYKYNSDNSYFQKRTVNTAGYPGDLSRGATQLYRASGPIQDVSRYQFGYNGTLDTAGGQGGSPGWEYNASAGTRQIVGVHVTGGSSFNRASRLTEGKFNAIQSWIRDDRAAGTPRDRPDLVSYDDWFSTSYSSFTTGTLRPGSSLRLRTVVRNNGTARAGRFKVSFYASTNNIISTADTKLGETTITSLDAFSFKDAVVNTSVPRGLASGDYYVGWIIDSGNQQAEFDERNNTDLITGQKLRVRSGRYSVLAASAPSELQTADALTGMVETQPLANGEATQPSEYQSQGELPSGAIATEALLTTGPSPSFAATVSETAERLAEPIITGTTERTQASTSSPWMQTDAAPLYASPSAPLEKALASASLPVPSLAVI